MKESDDDNSSDNITIQNSIIDINKILDEVEQSNEVQEKEVIKEIDKVLKNVNYMKLSEKSNGSLAQKYCYEQKYIHLKLFLLSLENIVSDKDELINYFLIEDISNMNIFETASEIGDIEIFNILSKYLENNQNLLNALIKRKPNNIFHISAKENKILSLLFFYHFYPKNPSIFNIKNQSTMTPLMIACYQGNYEYVRAIINLGADCNILDDNNKNALFFAVDSRNIRIIKYLIFNGINKNQIDKQNHKALYYAKEHDIQNILENKNIFQTIFQCPIVYRSLKNHHKHLCFNIFLVILILIQAALIVFFLMENSLNETGKECYDLYEEYIILIICASSEFLGLLFYFLIHFIDKKINSEIYFINQNNNAKIYELYSLNKNLCIKCKKVYIPGTQHCISCDKCINNWDHHCFWLNMCINKRNMVFFKIFMFLLLIISLSNISLSVFFDIDVFFHPKIYYLVMMECNLDESFDYISYIIFVCIILFIIINGYFLFSSLLPFMIEYICCQRNEQNNSNKKSLDVKSPPLISSEDKN